MQSSTVLCNAGWRSCAALLVTVILGPPCGPLTCKYYIGQARITFETRLLILSTRFCCRVHLFEVLIISPAVKSSFSQTRDFDMCYFHLTRCGCPFCLTPRRQTCKDRLLRSFATFCQVSGAESFSCRSFLHDDGLVSPRADIPARSYTNA